MNTILARLSAEALRARITAARDYVETLDPVADRKDIARYEKGIAALEKALKDKSENE